MATMDTNISDAFVRIVSAINKLQNSGITSNEQIKESLSLILEAQLITLKLTAMNNIHLSNEFGKLEKLSDRDISELVG